MSVLKDAISEAVNLRRGADATLATQNRSDHSLMGYRMLMALVIQHQILADFYAQQGNQAASSKHTKFANQFRNEALQARSE